MSVHRLNRIMPAIVAKEFWRLFFYQLLVNFVCLTTHAINYTLAEQSVFATLVCVWLLRRAFALVLFLELYGHRSPC